MALLQKRPPKRVAPVEEQMTLDLNEPDALLDYVDEWNSDHGFEATVVPQPTAFEPGSPGKVEVLVERLRLGHQLWHAEDARRSRGAQLIFDASQFVG